jgi:hypothetical protein
MDEKQLLAPYWFRFTDPADVKEYDEDWYCYDESALIRLPSRTLVAYEQTFGAPLVDVMNGMREGSVFGNLCGSWIAMRMAGRDVRFADYSPVVYLLEWRTEDPHMAAKEGDEGKADSPADTPGPTVALDVSPVAE